MLARRTRARLLPLVIFGLHLVAVGAPAAGDELPTADELIDKALEAMGGKAINKVESYSASSEMTSAMGTMTIETLWVRPDRVYVRTTIPQIGDMEMGTDGSIGWMSHPMMGYQLLVGDQMDQARKQAIHARLLRLRETIKENDQEIEGVGETEIDGVKCHELRLIRKANGVVSRRAMYFDAASGLIRAMRVAGGPSGAPTVIRFADWKTIDGVTFFHRMELEGGPATTVINYVRIELNKVSPERVALPEEVKKLAAEQSSKGAGAPSSTRPRSSK